MIRRNRVKSEVKRFSTETGLGKLTMLFFGTLLAGVLYIGYEIGPFFYFYFELQNQMEALVRMADENTDLEIRQKLMYHVNKMELPIDPEELKIERDNGMIRISLDYDEVFFITWEEKDHDIHTFHFHAYAEGPVVEEKRRR